MFSPVLSCILGLIPKIIIINWGREYWIEFRPKRKFRGFGVPTLQLASDGRALHDFGYIETCHVVYRGICASSSLALTQKVNEKKKKDVSIRKGKLMNDYANMHACYWMGY